MREDSYVEVITANKRPLEEVFGIDLILLNLTHANVVMLQYKMLEPLNADAMVTDWIYRPDAQLEEEIARMRVFDRDLAPDSSDYRFNSGMFYLKFVKRDAAIRHGGILTRWAISTCSGRIRRVEGSKADFGSRSTASAADTFESSRFLTSSTPGTSARVPPLRPSSRRSSRLS